MRDGVETCLASLWQSTGWSPKSSALEVRDGATAIGGALPITDIATAAYGALAMAAADLHRSRTSTALTPFVDRRLAGLAMTGNDYVRIDGAEPDKWGPITGYFQCGDGGYVYLHGQFPHLRDGLLTLFGADLNRDSMAKALSSWTAADAETAGQARGLCVIRLRDRAEWEAHPQYQALAASSVLTMTPIGANASDLPPGGAAPLSGVRVLDLSRVLAGPMAGRALAELGADVVRISTPDLPSLTQLVIDTGFGKRAAFADLDTAKGRGDLNRMIADADLLIDGFRPGALAAKGYGIKDLTALNPSLSIITLSAFGDVGPWAGRRGYDSYVQGGVGLAAPARKGDPPVRLPTQPLDYLTGCLCALGGVIALTHRRAGAAHLVEMSLARTAMWLWEQSDLLGPEPSPAPVNASFEALNENGDIRRVDSPFGMIDALAPPYGFDGDLVSWARPPQPLGSSPPQWSS